MRATSDILFGIAGQVLTHRVVQGRPTSATYRVLSDTSGDGAEPEFSGTATIDPVDAAVTSATGLGQPDPHRIPIASTTGIVVSRKYLLVEAGMSEWVSPTEIGASYIRARHPLRNAYSAAAKLVGTTIAGAVDDAWASDRDHLSDHLDPNPDYRVRWEFVVDGETFVEYSYFDLVRAAVRHGVDIDDINARAPGLHDSLPTEYRAEQGRPLIDAAWRAVQADLGALGVDTDAIRDDQVLDELVILRALVLLGVGGWKPLAFPTHNEYLTEVRADYNRFIEKSFLVQNSRRLASGTSGAAKEVFAGPIWGK